VIGWEGSKEGGLEVYMKFKPGNSRNLRDIHVDVWIILK
jgi:hypothetical protein